MLAGCVHYNSNSDQNDKYDQLSKDLDKLHNDFLTLDELVDTLQWQQNVEHCISVRNDCFISVRTKISKDTMEHCDKNYQNCEIDCWKMWKAIRQSKKDRGMTK